MSSDGGVTGDSSQYCLAGLKGSGSIHRYSFIHPFIILIIPYHAPVRNFPSIMAKLLFQKKKMAPRASFSLFKFFFFAIILILCSGTRPIRVSECPLAPGDISEGCVAVAQNREYRI